MNCFSCRLVMENENFSISIKQQTCCIIMCLSWCALLGIALPAMWLFPHEHIRTFVRKQCVAGWAEQHINIIVTSHNNNDLFGVVNLCVCLSVLALTESASLEVCREGGSSSDSSSEDSGFRFFFFPILMTILLQKGKTHQD